MRFNKITDAGKDVEAAGKTKSGEQTLCVIYQHPFGLILIYFVAFFGLGVAVVLISILLNTFFNAGGNANNYLVLITLIAAIIVLIALMLATFIYRQTSLTVTDKNVTLIMQRGLLNRKIISISIADIEDVLSEQHGIFANMFGFGVLKVETAGETVDINFGFCSNPTRIAGIILNAKDNFLGKHYLKQIPLPTTTVGTTQTD